MLDEGKSLHDFEFDDLQEKACRSFSLLTRKKRLVVLNTSDSGTNADDVTALFAAGHHVLAAPFGLELELQALPAEDRVEFAAEMGLG